MTFFVESLGCARNQVDSEQMIACLEAMGLHWVDRPEEAGIIIVNTCGFITSAKEQSIRAAFALKSGFPGAKVIMAGCLVERYGRQLEEAMGEIDGFVGVGDLEALQTLVLNLEEKGALPAPEAASRKYSTCPRTRLLSVPGSAYVKVAEGCANRCSYCAIPLIRGSLASRKRGDVLSEVEELLRRGVYEIVLVAQDLASFGRDRGKAELVALVKEISRLPGGFWLRLLYLHPDHFPLELLEVIAGDSRLLPYFDVPFQHASKALLSRMGRTGSAQGYLELVQRIRSRLPEAVIRSTLLVGFPGESEDDLEVLLDFQRRSELDWLGVFAYSREEGTPAYNFPGRVKKSVALRRKRQIERAQTAITRARLDRVVGRRLEVLVEEPIQGESLFLARSYLQAPEVDGLVVVKASGLKPGRIYPVRIDRRVGIDLEASLA